MQSNETICFFGDFDQQTLSSHRHILSSKLYFYDSIATLDSALSKFIFPFILQKEKNEIVFTVPDSVPISITIGSGTAEDCATSLLAYNKGVIGLDLYDIFSALQNGTTTFFGNLSENDLWKQKHILKNAMGAYIFFRFPKSTNCSLDFAEIIVSTIYDHCNKDLYIAWTAVVDESITTHTFDLFIAINKENLLA